MGKRASERELSEQMGPVVEQEARRLLSEAQLEADPELLAAGWERRFVADGQRACEATELYEQLGYEVCTRSLGPDELGDECEDCKLIALLQFQTIYTRKGQGE
jgi:hypothetical protein